MKKMSLSLILIAGFIQTVFGGNPAVTEVGPPLQLTTNQYFMAPVWAPVANIIAVTGSQYSGIYLVSYPDGKVRQISSEPAAGYGMQWAHNGNYIAAKISKYEQDKRYDAIALFNTSTGMKQLLTDYRTLLPGVPKWTTHDSFVFLSESRQLELYDINQPGISKRLSDLPAGEPLIYIRQDHITYKPSNAKSMQTLPDLSGQPLNLVVSPDGQKIAYEIIGGHLWVSGIDGSNRVDLGPGNEPSWNPGSDKLVYMITTDDGHQFTSSDIYIVNSDGTGKTNITNTPDILEMHPNWSHTDNLIAYNTYKTGAIFVREIQ